MDFSKVDHFSYLQRLKRKASKEARLKSINRAREGHWLVRHCDRGEKNTREGAQAQVRIEDLLE